MKIEFQRTQIYSPSIKIMQHIPRAGDSSLDVVPFRQVKHLFAGEKAHFYLKFLYPIYWEDSQEVFRHFPPFSFKYIYPEQWQLIQTLKGSIDFNKISWMKTAFPEA